MKPVTSIAVLCAFSFLFSTVLFPMKRKKPRKSGQLRKIHTPLPTSFPILINNNKKKQHQLVPASLRDPYGNKLPMLEESPRQQRLFTAIKNNQTAAVRRLLRKPDITHMATAVKYDIANNHPNLLVKANDDPDHAWHILLSFLDIVDNIKYGNEIGLLREVEQEWTLLHNLAHLGYFDPLDTILERSIGPDIRSDRGNTPLHIAAAQGYYTIVQRLLDYGADASIENNQNKTPSMIVQEAKLSCISAKKFARLERIERALRRHAREALPEIDPLRPRTNHMLWRGVKTRTN